METGTGQSRYSLQQGPVVRRPISANPGLKFSPNFFISLLKSLFREKFPYSFSRTSNNQIVSKKIWTEFSFIAFRREIKFHTNPVLSYLTQLWTTRAKVFYPCWSEILQSFWQSIVRRSLQMAIVMPWGSVHRSGSQDDSAKIDWLEKGTDITRIIPKTFCRWQRTCRSVPTRSRSQRSSFNDQIFVETTVIPRINLSLGLSSCHL